MQQLINQHVLENPTAALVVLFVLAALALALHRVTKRRVLLYVAGAGAVAMVAVALVSFLVDTDRERVQKVIEDLRTAVEHSDAAAFDRQISPEGVAVLGSRALDAAALKRVVGRVFSVLQVRRIVAAAEPPQFDGDRAEVLVSMVTDVQAPVPYPDHHSRWLLTLGRDKAAPHGWAVRRIEEQRFDARDSPEVAAILGPLQ